VIPAVVHVASGREWRGGQRQVWLLARELGRAGLAGQVVVTGAGSELAVRLMRDDIRVREARWDSGLDPRVLLPILREVRAGGVLLHAHDAHAVTLAGVVAALTGVPLSAETTLACTVGALVPHKDHATLLHAARLLAGQFPALHWVIAGEGELRPVLEWLAAELGMAGRVHFLGHVSQPLGVIADADVYVMSSREEGLGTSVLDAMARGIPVASTSAGGLPEMLYQGAGILVPPRNPDALAGAVRRILCDPDLSARLVEQAARAVESFSAERMAAEVLTVYRSCAPILDGS
jgi:glycosyltransferase involved in cell wall biosynthesis